MAEIPRKSKTLKAKLKAQARARKAAQKKTQALLKQPQSQERDKQLLEQMDDAQFASLMQGAGPRSTPVAQPVEDDPEQLSDFKFDEAEAPVQTQSGDEPVSADGIEAGNESEMGGIDSVGVAPQVIPSIPGINQADPTAGSFQSVNVQQPQTQAAPQQLFQTPPQPEANAAAQPSSPSVQWGEGISNPDDVGQSMLEIMRQINDFLRYELADQIVDKLTEGG